MARIAHLSDIHFGAHDPRIVDAATAWLEERRPDLVVISGDLTQRARVEQFRAAAAWLNRLRAAGLKILVIPGNHDVPLFNVISMIYETDLMHLWIQDWHHEVSLPELR